jgi:hypothetical protein
VNGTDSTITQTPLFSQTVFNFFYPGYSYPGAISAAGMTTPEFQLTNDSNVVLLTNVLNNGVLRNTGSSTAGNPNGFSSFFTLGGNVVMDFGSYATVAQTQDSNLQVLIPNLYALLCGSNLSTSSNTYTAIKNYVVNNWPVPANATNYQITDRLRSIIQLIVTSPEYSIQK